MPNSKKTAAKKVQIMDTTLRDAHQSLLATRMKTEDLLPVAEVMDGNPAANPWGDFAWPAIPGHFGPTWFLPFVGAYYKLQDILH